MTRSPSAAGVAVDAEIELERAARVRFETMRQAGEPISLSGGSRLNVTGIERHAPGRARQREILQQPAERDAPILERFEHGVLRLLEQAGERLRAIELRAHRQHVHAMADEMIAVRRIVLSGRRHADREIALAA